MKNRLKKIYNLLFDYYNRLIKGSEIFKFQNHSYHYFINEYNQTWRNERIVEIPIIKRIVDKNADSSILEIGNVLSHYFYFDHDVVDKYDKSKNIINADAANFKLTKKYDLIVTISTLEHIGWDEKKRDFKKVLKVIDNLKSHLKKGGRIVFTHPLGYNPVLDKYIKEGNVDCKEKFLLRRVSASNSWREVTWNQIFTDIKYGDPFPYANGIVVGIIQGKGSTFTVTLPTDYSEAK